MDSPLLLVSSITWAAGIFPPWSIVNCSGLICTKLTPPTVTLTGTVTLPVAPLTSSCPV